MEHSLENNQISIYLNKSIYSLDAIFKCIYWYGNNWNVIVDEDSANQKYLILIKSKKAEFQFDDNKSEILVGKFLNDINDFQLRDIITKETKNIRDLLVAKAFSNGEFDEEPPGEFEDFIGRTQ